MQRIENKILLPSAPLFAFLGSGADGAGRYAHQNHHFLHVVGEDQETAAGQRSRSAFHHPTRWLPTHSHTWPRKAADQQMQCGFFNFSMYVEYTGIYKTVHAPTRRACVISHSLQLIPRTPRPPSHDNRYMFSIIINYNYIIIDHTYIIIMAFVDSHFSTVFSIMCEVNKSSLLPSYYLLHFLPMWLTYGRTVVR